MTKISGFKKKKIAAKKAAKLKDEEKKAADFFNDPKNIPELREIEDPEAEIPQELSEKLAFTELINKETERAKNKMLLKERMKQLREAKTMPGGQKSSFLVQELINDPSKIPEFIKNSGLSQSKIDKLVKEKTGVSFQQLGVTPTAQEMQQVQQLTTDQLLHKKD